ncbi:hypothetical protein VTK73DRAFT_263 [Phialemonium thermophilum]|uniref:Probable dipeptidyl-aminopeptidase B n=1 Tax=Phialemonium thermophilum TaxID=223376 RepID=A0ABR3XFK7_9PEZI
MALDHDEGDLSLPLDEGLPRVKMSRDSLDSVSTTSLIFDRINERLSDRRLPDEDDDDEDQIKDERATDELESGPFLSNDSAEDGGAGRRRGVRGCSKEGKPMDRTLRRFLIVASALFVSAWVVGLVLYMFGSGRSRADASYAQPTAVSLTPGVAADDETSDSLSLDQIMSGYWAPTHHSIRWIAGANGEDGLLVERGASGKDYLVVEDVRAKEGSAGAVVRGGTTLIKSGTFTYNGTFHRIEGAIPSQDLRKVLAASEIKSNWRHSSTAAYWIVDVETQSVEPLIPGQPGVRVQLAQWSPKSDAIAFTRDNNLYLRRIGSDDITQVTQDGGAEVFNGVPDWVYEEEVLADASATWWSQDGNYIAFLRTNESGVPEYPVQYFFSRPSGQEPPPGEEVYPEVRMIKYPKAGAHNPVVRLKFYDVRRGDVFDVSISGEFADEDRLITSVVWAGGKVLIKETNRVSDILRVVLVDVVARTGEAVRTVDVKSIDGGWFEISQRARYIPADATKDRLQDGYVDMVIHDDGDHLAYFTPLDNPNPIMLTSGKGWEVVNAPSAVDLDQNLVYFVATKESSIQRHVYSVKLSGQDLVALTDTTKEGYYDVSFSSGAGYALLSYQGPNIPWQKVISTPSNPDKYEYLVEANKGLAEKVGRHKLPTKVYGTLIVDGIKLNYVERRPPNFDESRRHPVLFQQYSGPGSQMVNKKFGVDFQSYVAAGLGYLVVTVDGRGTGFIGRKARVLVRGELGKWESHDQIAAAKHWASLPYVDASRLAIWGWSFGGFTTLKTLEQDAGQTFRYGMAVAPVTDWRFYDSVYTERYMLTPQTNAAGYDRSAVRNASALAQNVRFLLMHGVADDNVHMQNSLALLDQLDLEGVENYDVHVFPDSDHGISFHNANRIVYDKLTNWLINAFNGEWLKVDNAQPNGSKMR